MNEWLAAKNILAVRLDNIGDVVMLGPALRAVKETSPQARLTLLASPAGSTAVPLLPWLDDVITWRPIWQDVGGCMPFHPARERELINMLAERQFDAALIFTSFSQTPHTPGYVCYLAGIPLRAGESKEFGGSTLTTELEASPDDLHQVERNLRLVEHLGFVARDRRLMLAIPEEARQAVPSLLERVGLDPDAPFLLVHPGASAQARRYPVERFGIVARLLTRRGWPILVTGVEREAVLLAELMQHAPDARCLVGGATLAVYAALVERAALVICNDTLPMHLADAVGTPEVVLFSGTDYEEQWRPRTTVHRLLRRPTSCHPCYLFECPIGLPCLDIPPEEVVENCDAVLEEVRSVGRVPRLRYPSPGANDRRKWMIDRTRQKKMDIDHGMTPARRATMDDLPPPGGISPTPGRAQGIAPTDDRGQSYHGRGDPCGRPTGAYEFICNQQPRKIAVFRALYLGDLLLAVPALRSIRTGFPGAEITLIGLPWAASFARRFSRYIDRFVEFVGYPGIQEVDADPEKCDAGLEEQRAYGYDLVIQMHGSGRVSDEFALALNGQVTVGYYEDILPAGLTAGMPYPEDEPEVLRNLGLARLLGCPNLDPELEFPLFNEDRGEAARLLCRLARANRPWIGLHAGAKSQARRWPAEYFARVADHFAQRFNAQIILAGSPIDESTVQILAKRMRIQPLNVAGQTSLGGLAALISELDLFISNDTGPAHIANAVDTPSITIFGPVDPRRWAALDQSRHPIVRRGVSCSPCEYSECPIDHRCLRWITPDSVIEVASQLLL